MEVIRAPFPDSSQSRSSADGELATVHQLHPPAREGVFLPPVEPLPKYNTVVDTTYRKILETTRHEGIGTTWREEWRMDDGTKYEVLLGEPLRRKTDIVVANDTPWGTQVTGFNEDVAKLELSMGYPVLYKGPEIGTELTLAHSAHNTNAVLDVAERLGYYQKGLVIVQGYSRGSMIGFGTVAYAPQHGRRAIYANLTDPYGANKMDFSWEQIQEFAEVGALELATVGAELGSLILNPAKAWRFRRTVDLSLNGAKQFIRTGRAVVSDETAFLARHFPEDGEATVAIFGNPEGRRRKAFEQLLADKPGVEIKGFRSGHLKGMNHRVLGNIANKFSGIIDQLEDGVMAQDLDYNLVHHKVGV